MARDASGGGRPDRGVGSDEIFTLLRAAEHGDASVADLCAARGVTVPTYCVWKARYQDLSLAELRAARDREVRRGRVTAAAIGAAVVVCASGAALLVAYPAPRPETATARPAQRHPAATAATPPRSDQNVGPAPAASAGRPETSSPAAESSTRSGTATTDAGYFVQVAAMPDERMAARLVDRLGANGHHAVIVPSTVNGVRVFRVRLGPYDAKAPADALVSIMERQGYTGSWVTR